MPGIVPLVGNKTTKHHKVRHYAANLALFYSTLTPITLLINLYISLTLTFAGQNFVHDDDRRVCPPSHRLHRVS